MKGRILKRANRYYVVVDRGICDAQRCDECRKRWWVEASPLTECPKCSGPLTRTKERRRDGFGGYRLKKGAKGEVGAEDRLDEVLKQLGAGHVVTRQTVGEFLPDWLDRHGRDLRPRTLHRYRHFVNVWWLPKLADLRLDEVKPTHIKQVDAAMAEAGLASSTRRQARAVLSAAYAEAVEGQLCSFNPVAATKAPKLHKPELEILHPEQVIKILEVAESTGWRIPILLAGMTAARRSEVLGLKWSDIDLDARRMMIRRSLQANPETGELEFLDNKTDRSKRTITLTPTAVDALASHRKTQTERRLKAGEAWQDLDLVCDRGDGGATHPDTFTKATKRVMKAAGVPPRARLHDLRHGVAILLALEGVPLEAVAAILGHSSAGFTLSVYRHVVDEMTAQAADAIERRLKHGESTWQKDGRKTGSETP